MSVLISRAKRILPLKLRVWLRRDVKFLPYRIKQTLKGEATPPSELIYTIIGDYHPRGYIKSGAQVADAIRETLGRAGIKLDSLRSVLDFGCGVGRVIRHFPDVPELHGCDYNPELIKWCSRNLRCATFKANPLEGPLPYADESFDFVYAFSVFTHLTEPLQHVWMDEMRRILKPRGLLYLTLHGESYLYTLDDGGRRAFKAGRFVAQGEHNGSNRLAAYHPQSYVRGEFSRGFEVVSFEPEGAGGPSSQDAWLLRKA